MSQRYKPINFEPTLTLIPEEGDSGSNSTRSNPLVVLLQDKERVVTPKPPEPFEHPSIRPLILVNKLASSELPRSSPVDIRQIVPRSILSRQSPQLNLRLNIEVTEDLLPEIQEDESDEERWNRSPTVSGPSSPASSFMTFSPLTPCTPLSDFPNELLGESSCQNPPRVSIIPPTPPAPVYEEGDDSFEARRDEFYLDGLYRKVARALPSSFVINEMDLQSVDLDEVIRASEELSSYSTT
ncbi:hypothetical protein M408DRAFT_329544 [Serendipita vermifera MAFF 305830]|uniref:Uncharacterized protein n=1 Tax=Serendipita vermifera MAFF 305830 TaxID=933852 RepID=A0A0C3B7T1_SERVB|nr:hypothetical protein M408DRAFT_329544 [Serendipita vermifera MAFF 305830]